MERKLKIIDAQLKHEQDAKTNAESTLERVKKALENERREREAAERALNVLREKIEIEGHNTVAASGNLRGGRTTTVGRALARVALNDRSQFCKFWFPNYRGAPSKIETR